MSAITISAPSYPLTPTNPGGNSTAASLVEPLPTKNRPDQAPVTSGVVAVGDGVIACGHGGAETNSGIEFVFYGVGTNGQTFNANIYAWKQADGNAVGLFTLWVPKLLVSLTGITLNSNIPGIANTPVPAAANSASQFFASAVTLNIGNQGTDVDIISPGSGVNEIASVYISTKGARFIEVRFNMNSSAAAANALWSKA
jgi:hypothetical protein